MEVFPSKRSVILQLSSFLHTRGGVSVQHLERRVVRVFSPHTWRCFSASSLRPLPRVVFSTHVEVFLCDWIGGIFGKSFLHTRGGVSWTSTCDTLLG